MNKDTASTLGRRLRYLAAALVLLSLVFPGLAHVVVAGTVTVLLTVAAANVKILVILAAVWTLTRVAPKTSRTVLRKAFGPRAAFCIVPATA